MLKLYKRPTKGGGFVWWVRGTVRGQGCHESAGTDREELAKAFRAKREAELYETGLYGKRAAVSFATAARSYLEHEARSAHTLDYVGRLQIHFGITALAQIDQARADQAAKSILSPDAAPATRRRVVYGPLAAILNHAAKRGWCDKPQFDLPSLPKSKTGWLTPHDALRLIGAASPHMKPLLIFLLGTGARLSEALDLEWGDVHLSESRVIFRDTKTKVDRVASMPSAAVAAVSSLTGREGKVFRRADGEPYNDRERNEGGQIKTGFRATCRRAGLICWEKTGDGAGITLVRWVPIATPHVLRHTWASWLYVLTRDPILVRDEGRWASLSMVERYAHLAPPEIAQDVALVWGASHPKTGALPSPPSAHGLRLA